LEFHLHQPIKNGHTIGPGNRIENIEAGYSGYYCCDEQSIKLNGKRNYILTLYNHILNIVVVVEGITSDRGHGTIMKFLQKYSRK